MILRSQCSQTGLPVRETFLTKADEFQELKDAAIVMPDCCVDGEV
jgi:hypothetical protein